MSDRLSAIEAYQNALVSGDVDTVAGYLAPGVVVDTNFGHAEGTQAALALLREPRTAGLLAAGARWSEPVTDGDSITVTAGLPATAPVRGIEFVFGFAGATITRVEQQTLPAAPMLIAYGDDTGEIHLSFRGTIQAHSGDQLALWARDPEGGPGGARVLMLR